MKGFPPAQLVLILRTVRKVCGLSQTLSIVDQLKNLGQHRILPFVLVVTYR